MKKFGSLRWLVAIILVALAVRLYGITLPVADWHSWRQADTASVTREYVKHGIDILHPRYHDLSDIPAKQPNLEGYRMVEFPIVNAGIAAVLRTFPSLPLVTTSRMVAVLSSLITLLAVYVLVRELSGEATALASALVFAVLPYSVYYSRVILPEPFMLTASTVAVMAFLLWLKSGKAGWWLLATVSLMVAFLLKPFVVFLAPVFGAMLILYARDDWRKWLFSVVLALAAVGPMFWWREWIKQYPAGIPASDWLFNGPIDGQTVRFKPFWFRWIAYERLTKLFLGWVGVVFLPLGLSRLRQDTLVYLAWWSGMAVYVTVVARGNVQHDYYQNLLIPIVAITVGSGMVHLYEWLRKGASVRSAWVTVVALGALSWLLTWQHIKGYYNVNHWEYIEAGQAADALLPADAKVIAPAYGDTHFLFQTNRTGWPIGFKIEEKRAQGAQFFVTTSDDWEVRELQEKYPLFHKGERFTILDLRTPL